MLQSLNTFKNEKQLIIIVLLELLLHIPYCEYRILCGIAFLLGDLSYFLQSSTVNINFKLLIV